MNIQLQSLEAQFSEYIARKRRKFDLKKLGIHSDLRELSGTSLQKAVWRELFNIPYGKTITYSDLAMRVGNPKAVRAVASAVANNPICIIIPCHRVLPKQSIRRDRKGGKRDDGKVSDEPINIGNYALGREIKKILLEIEGVVL
jgi:O-6-methylguanine DNA methyltransferase